VVLGISGTNDPIGQGGSTSRSQSEVLMTLTTLGAAPRAQKGSLRQSARARAAPFAPQRRANK
jgi:hypothetical protein